MSNQKELEKHFERNEKMWKIWEQRGVNSETNLRVFFHFYATNKEDLNSLCQELEEDNIVYQKKEVRTFIFFNGATNGSFVRRLRGYYANKAIIN